jgi:hypothetical protein
MALTKVTNFLINGAPANPLDFGAVPDGSASSTAAVQSAFDASDAVTLSAANNTYQVGEVNTTDTGVVFDGAGKIVNTIASDTSGNTLYVQPFVASTTDMRLIVDKTSTKCLTNLLEFKNIGFNVVMVDGLSGTGIKEYLDNAYSLQMGVVLEFLTNTPEVTYDNHPALIGYYLYDEPANQGVPISIATQNVRINAWKAATSKPLMSTFYGQYDLNAAMSPLWDVIFMDWYYRTSNTDAENISLALRAFANLQLTCPQTRVIPMVAAFTETGVCTSVSKRINFSRDMVRFSDDGSYAVFAWIPELALFPASPQNDADFYDFCKELPLLVKSKSPYRFATISFTPMIGGVQYFNAALSGTFLKINEVAGGALAFQQTGGTAVFDLPAMGMTDCQFLFRNTVPFDVSTTTIRVYQSEDAFINQTALIVWANTPDNTQLTGLLYNNGPRILGINFDPAASSVTFGKYIQGFMIYTNWVQTTF